MGYVDRTLGAHEKIVYRAHFPILFWAMAGAAILAPAALLAVSLTAGGAGTANVLAMAGSLGLPFGAYYFLTRAWTMAATEIAVTTHRVVIKKGLLRTQTDEIAIPNIETVQMHQGVVGVMLGLGSFTIEGTGDDKIETPVFADVFGFRRAIENGKAE